MTGKPSLKFYQKCLEKINSKPEETMFISDDPISDLYGAKKAGMKTCFVLSGKYPSTDILGKLEKDYKPDYIYNSISDIDC